MCWACEEQELMFRYELEMAVARGVIPDGFTPEDFEAAGLPVPGRKDAAKTPFRSASAFICDTPDKE
jgi:hypothetical protein